MKPAARTAGQCAQLSPTQHSSHNGTRACDCVMRKPGKPPRANGRMGRSGPRVLRLSQRYWVMLPDARRLESETPAFESAGSTQRSNVLHPTPQIPTPRRHGSTRAVTGQVICRDTRGLTTPCTRPWRGGYTASATVTPKTAAAPPARRISAQAASVAPVVNTSSTSTTHRGMACTD